jgi:peptide methionine sulfoxide reductase MsrA
MEPPFDKLDGVISTISGYAGGKKKILPMRKFPPATQDTPKWSGHL